MYQRSSLRQKGKLFVLFVAILFRPFELIGPKHFEIICLSNLSILSVPDEGYSSNVPDEGYSKNVLFPLNLISTFYSVQCRNIKQSFSPIC